MDCTLNKVISTDIAALKDKRSHSQACDRRRTTAVQVDTLGTYELSCTFRAFAAQQLPASTCRSHTTGIQTLCIHCAYAQSSCRAAAAVCAHPLQLSGTLYANASLKRNHHHERAAATALLLRQDDCSVSVQLSQVRQQSVCVRPKYIVARCVTAALYLATDVMQRCNPLGVCSPETIMNGSRLAAGDHSLASRDCCYPHHCSSLLRVVATC